MIGESECCSMTNNNIDPATSNKVSLVHTCSRAFLSAVPLMLPCEGDGEGGKECWGGYLFFRWSMKVSRLRSMSALCRLVRASRLWAAMTVCRCSEVWTSPTLEKRRALFPSVRYSRGYSRSSVEIMWPPPRSGSGLRERWKGARRSWGTWRVWHQHPFGHARPHAYMQQHKHIHRQTVEENGVKGRKREKWDEMLALLQQKGAQERVAAPCRVIDLRFSRKEGTKEK